MKRGRAFVGLAEAPISFPPTYKLDKHKAGLAYDTSAKRRTPSWTDRILYKEGSGTTVLKYDADFEPTFSDHKPVVGVFEL
jgi:hypothetical protein